MKKTINKQNAIDVRQLCFDNQLEIINQNKISSWRSVKRPSISRLGFELLGHFYNDDLSMNIIGWGTTESKYMDRLDKKDLEKTLTKIFKKNPPLVICSINVNDRNKKIIISEATKNNVPVVVTDTQLSYVITTIGIYIAEHFAPVEFVHGSLVIINGVGVLLIGDSGIGKSEAVLELIQRGHTFVSDDSVNIKRVGNKFVGSSPEITQNILEARGLGLIDIKNLYGEKAIKNKTDINLVVELKQSTNNKNEEFDRLGTKQNYFEILGGKIHKVIIPVRLGRNVASLVEVATNLFESKQEGFDIIKIIEKRIKNA